MCIKRHDPLVPCTIIGVRLLPVDTVIIAYPIRWGQEPRIIDIFVKSYDFSGKTLVPICTSGGSNIGRSGEAFAALTIGAVA